MKKILLLLILSVAYAGFAFAGGTVNGIIATYEGATTSYKLEQMPTVKYEEVGGVKHAVLYLSGQSTPILSVELTEGKTLELIYGEYKPTAIDGTQADKATIIDRGGKKIIQGGKLVIIGKDGRKYTASGTLIEQ